MKSSSPFPQKSAPSLSRQQRQNQEVEQRINQILFHSMQLQRTLWLAAMESKGEIVIDESAIPPLWNLEYTRVPDHPSLLRIKASLLPEATPEQLDKLAAMLLGKKDDPSDAIDKVGLGEYPKSYTVKALQSRVIFATPAGEKDNVWMTRADYDKHFPQTEPPQPQPPAPHGV